MALLIHRCTTCGHPDFYHHAKGCTAGCRCPQDIDTVRQDTPPEVIPTFGPLGQPISRLITPGATWSGGQACDCQACRDHHAQHSNTTANAA